MNASKGTILSQGLLKFQNMIDAPHMQKIQRASGENLSVVCYASKCGTSEKQLKLLGSYFGKLRVDVSQPSSNSCNKRTELAGKSANKESWAAGGRRQGVAAARFLGEGKKKVAVCGFWDFSIGFEND
ncbi:unnamed protein product [Dovyalis caffra]|uniref:Uncharacterized protein n=1 Tax=Dovyalis caffra TaxID=77055 RepID=A0AAV1R049_9ROSI|nr:unnamed protein product [Dovyalis caffra]